MDGLKAVGAIIGIILLILVLVWAENSSDNRHRSDIAGWASENGYRIVEVDKKTFDTGPFWFSDDDDDHYRVVVEDSDHIQKVSWFRFTGFGHYDQKWGK